MTTHVLPPLPSRDGVCFPTCGRGRIFRFQSGGLKRLFGFCLCSLRPSTMSSQDAALRPSRHGEAHHEKSIRPADSAAPAAWHPTAWWEIMNSCFKWLGFQLICYAATGTWNKVLRDSFGVKCVYFPQYSPHDGPTSLHIRPTGSIPGNSSI